jgi:hypothetical protein
VDSFYERRGATGGLANRDILVGAIDCKGIPMVKSEPARRVLRREEGGEAEQKEDGDHGRHLRGPRRRTPETVLRNLFYEGPTPKRRRTRQHRKDKRVWASLLGGKDNFISRRPGGDDQA